jgi:NADPH:quinone reductase-like Zn-dependent oxidoreductase
MRGRAAHAGTARAPRRGAFVKAVVFADFGAAPALRDDLTRPAPGEGELLVRVQASSVNPIDNVILAGYLRGLGEYEVPVVLGRDFAGVVEQVGPGVGRFGAGDEVFGFVGPLSPNIRDGSWAECIAVPEQTVAAKPAGVTTAVAGATPLAGITATLAVEALKLTAGARVLIVGASGGVGSFAVQLAAHAGAHVIATAFEEDHDHLRALGAAELVDRDGDVAGAVRSSHPDGVDALIDLVSQTPEAHRAYLTALGEGGHVASPLPGVGDGPRHSTIIASPDAGLLDRLARMLDDGTLRVPIQNSYALEEAPTALVDKQALHTQGKLAITVV